MTVPRWVLACIALTAMLLAPATTRGARIITKSNQRFTGTIVEETPQKVTISTDSGKVTIPVTAIRQMIRDVAPKEEKKIVPAKIKATQAPKAFQEAKAAIKAGNWVKGGSQLAGLLKLPSTVFAHEKRLAATAALATCHLQIADTEGAAKVFKRRASLVSSESDKKRLLATAEALQTAETPTGASSEKWQFVQTYDQAIDAGTKWKANQLLEKAKEIGEKAEGLNKWTTMKRVADKILENLNEADLYVPGFSTTNKEAALSTIAENVVQAAEKAVKVCTEERKFNITPYYQTSASSTEHGRIYNEYVTRYLTRRKAAEDALKNIKRLAEELGVSNLYTKREEKVKELLTQLDELRYHLKIHGMHRKLRIAPRRLGTPF